MSETELRSELGIKFDEWLETQDGKDCVDSFDVDQMHFGVGGKKVNERVMTALLEKAFLAGARANEQVYDELADKLTAVLYFDNDEDRSQFMTAAIEAMPNAVAKKIND